VIGQRNREGLEWKGRRLTQTPLGVSPNAVTGQVGVLLWFALFDHAVHFYPIPAMQ